MDKELFCTWYFKPESGGDDGPNDALAENFNSKPTISLVRESIQNSLDAAIENSGKPVRVEYTFGELPIEDVPNLSDIRPHIQGCLDLYYNNDNAKEFFPPMLNYIDNMGDHIPYIKISDSNTFGMNYVDDYHTDEPFYAFVRSKGVTAKRNVGSGGSFGFGKAAYFGMSMLKTVLISTLTEDGKPFFQGVASLCTHVLEGEEGKFAAIGYYDNNDGLPVDDASYIPDFLKREEGNSGTDFWIIGYDKSQKESIIKDMTVAALRSFWLSIVKEELVVVINGKEINHENIQDVMKVYFPDDSDSPTSNRENFNPRPYLEAIINGEHVGNPKFVCVTKNLDILGEVKLYVYLNKRGSNKIILTRKPKMLVQLKNVSPIGVYGVFICENEKGNKMLKRMENPAHTLWLAGRKQDTREAYKELEKFLSDTIASLRPVSGKKSMQIMGLSDIIWIPESLNTEDAEPDDESEHEGRKLTNENTDDENGNQVALIQKIATKTAVKKKQIIEDDEDALEDQMDEDGEEGSGPGPDPMPHPPVPGPPHPGPGPGPEPGPHPGPSPKPRPKRKTAEVRLRQKASVENGEIVHILSIYPPRDIANANIGLMVSWEDGYAKQPIEKAYLNGIEVTVIGNKIVNVPLKQIGDKIKVRFYDNIKHAIKLSVEDESN